jgi:hypothetical protein
MTRSVLRAYQQARLYAGFYFAGACSKRKSTAQWDKNRKKKRYGGNKTGIGENTVEINDVNQLCLSDQRR